MLPPFCVGDCAIIYQPPLPPLPSHTVGEAAAGKGTPGASTLLPNTRMECLNAQSGGAASALAHARNAAIERGERLQQLDMQTQEMVDQAKGFGRTAALIAAKYEKKDRRWGWPL